MTTREAEADIRKVPKPDHIIVEIISERSGLIGSIARKIQNAVRKRRERKSAEEAKKIHDRILGKR